ncbi:MAG: GGDEF domain-containing protein [Actinobacteria bacterium]|nr:GGDEF domain-containing protein [Actinomycetota bacterium]
MSAIKQEACIDRTTGLLNRAALDDKLSDAVRMRSQTDGQLGCILIDIDHFKSINDRYGHAVGDQVLQEVSTRLRTTIRADDAVFRYGGEEFCVIVEDGDASSSMLVAERALSALSAQPISAISVTASAGVAAWQSSFRSSEDLLLAADRALYNAKSSGRAHAQQASVAAVPNAG